MAIFPQRAERSWRPSPTIGEPVECDGRLGVMDELRLAERRDRAVREEFGISLAWVEFLRWLIATGRVSG